MLVILILGVSGLKEESGFFFHARDWLTEAFWRLCRPVNDGESWETKRRPTP